MLKFKHILKLFYMLFISSIPSIAELEGVNNFFLIFFYKYVISLNYQEGTIALFFLSTMCRVVGISNLQGSGADLVKAGSRMANFWT